MKKISSLKILNIICLIAFIFQVIDFFVWKGGLSVFSIISTCLIFGGLMLAFAFAGKIEQAKIDKETAKQDRLNN